MPLKLYNTLTRKKEIFKPLKGNSVRMYVCGPTIYNYVHIGNLRAYVFADTLRRVLKFNNFDLKEVMNLTDIDDKTIRDSQKEGISLSEFTSRYEKAFLKNIAEMNIQIPEVMPKATEHIKEMVELTETLLKKGYAYKAKDGVYFDISKMKGYGKLAQLKKASLKAGASERVSKDEYDKENANDFVLWKFYDEKDGDVFWETPLGKGRPGWHIECSAMSSKYLGNQFDIHTGGVDLIFPHHTNEIAQSECAFGVRPWVQTWVHNEHVMVDDKKMSKSLGNFYTLEDLKKKRFSPIAFRYFCLLTHYRKKLNFTLKNLEATQKTYEKLKNIILEFKDDGKTNKEYLKEFEDALNDDLNTPKALQIVWKLVRDKKSTGKIKTIEKMDEVLGLDLLKKEEIEIPVEVQKLVKERENARKNKNWKKADELREKINGLGFVLDDTPDGVVVKKV